MQALDTFRNALALSEKMAKLAKEQAWEALAATERQRATLLATLPTSLVAERGDNASFAELILKIRDCDNEVREFVEPWMEQTRVLLDRLSPPKASK